MKLSTNDRKRTGWRGPGLLAWPLVLVACGDSGGSGDSGTGSDSRTGSETTAAEAEDSTSVPTTSDGGSATDSEGVPTTDPSTSTGPGVQCGDGVQEGDEACDNGVDNADDKACKADCTVNVCGDGAVGPGESCDDGDDDDTDECTSACTAAVCGDAFVQPTIGEACDDGADNGAGAMCTPDCLLAVCGDGHVLDGGEQCDDGADNNGPGQACLEGCILNICGDGDNGPNEGCDDGADGDSDDGCTDLCQIPVCGDGFIQASLQEQCDDGGPNNGPGQSCNAMCMHNVCGDGDKLPVEQCDDGNLDDADNCSALCQEQKVLQIGSSNIVGCARLSGGVVKCWGYGGYLGLGDTATRGDNPGEMGAALPPVDLGPGESAVSLAYGNSFTCALLATGSFKCWGLNNAGQLGQGDTADRGDGPGEMGAALPPVDLGPDTTTAAVSAGFAHACALLADGRVKCWGYNFNGQLGLGDTANRGDGPGEMGTSLPAVALGAGLTVDTLAMGELHACALFTNHTVKCWGFGAFGALGLGDVGDRGTGPGEMGASLPTIDLGTGRTALAIAVGHHTCALLDNLTVKCWGFGDFGQLGQGNTNWIGDSPGEMGDSLPAIAVGTGVTPDLLVAMLYDTCILTTNDLVKCWGGNLNGQLGQGDNIYRGDGPGEMGDALPYIDVW